jgi:hypothetical protein
MAPKGQQPVSRVDVKYHDIVLPETPSDVTETIELRVEQSKFHVRDERKGNSNMINAQLAALGKTCVEDSDYSTLGRTMKYQTDFEDSDEPFDMRQAFPAVAHVSERLPGKSFADATKVHVQEEPLSEEQSNQWLDILRKQDPHQLGICHCLSELPRRCGVPP